MIYTEPLRPQIHFSPKRNWMNDPNGCVYFNGTYHLYFQHHPHSTVWGPMHWGHAESKDLIHWEEKNIALYPDDELGMAFSGSAVIDEKNISGFFPEEPGLLAYYTNHLEMEDRRPGLQQQSLAWSRDGGATWESYDKNPIISNPGSADFRDPKVFYQRESDSWSMVLSGGDRVLIYRSEDMKTWKQSGIFHIGTELGVVECPDLFPMKGLDGTECWIMAVSFLSAYKPELPTLRYFTGDFDGNTFINLSPEEGITADYGRDFYAAQSWSGIPSVDGRRIWIGWSSHWAYSNEIPTHPWRGIMSLPRELSLDIKDGNPVLIQQPVKETETLRSETGIYKGIQGDGIILELDPESPHEFLLSMDLPSESSLELIFNYSELEHWQLMWDGKARRLTMTRDELETSGFNDFFRMPTTVEIGEIENLELRIILDRSLVEIFIQGGEYTMTSQIFPSHPLKSLSVRKTGESIIEEFVHHRLSSIWDSNIG